MRAFLIDPIKKTVSEYEYDGDYRSINQALGCNVFTCVDIDDENLVYVDDEGLLKSPEHFFTMIGGVGPLAGRGLVLGVDPFGASVDTSLMLHQVVNLVSFPDAKFVGVRSETIDLGGVFVMRQEAVFE